MGKIIYNPPGADWIVGESDGNSEAVVVHNAEMIWHFWGTKLACIKEADRLNKKG